MPQPLVAQTAEQLRGYIEGPDPTTKRPFMVEVIEGLTKPLDLDDLKGAGLDPLRAAAAGARHRRKPPASVLA